MLKIEKGTRSGPNLCRSCRNATVAKGARDSHEIIRCSNLQSLVPFDVVECSDYDDKGKPSLTEYRKTAWILETNKNNRQIGFIPYKQWQEEHKGEMALPNEYEN